MTSSQQSNIPVVLITGFGPFRSVLVNPSWEVAKALKTYLEWTRPIHIILKQLQVTYDDVTTKVPDYWIKYNPTVSYSIFKIKTKDFVIYLVSYSSWCSKRLNRNQIRTMCM